MKYLLICLFSVSALGARYHRPHYGFFFEYDESKWELVPDPKETSQAPEVDKKMAEKTLVTVQRKQADEKYHARFSVVVDNKELSSKGTTPLAAYHKHALDFLKSQRFHVVSSEEKKLRNVDSPAIEIIANQRDFGLTFRQVIFLRDKEAYLLTVATRTKSYDSLRAETNRFFDSFTFGKAVRQ